MGPFTTPQVADIVHTSQRRLLSAVERGFVSPTVQEASGHGSRRLWSLEDVIIVAAVVMLHGSIAVKALRRMCEWFTHQAASEGWVIAVNATWLFNDESMSNEAWMEPVEHLKPGSRRHKEYFKRLQDGNQFLTPQIIVDFGAIGLHVKGEIKGMGL